MKIILLSLVVFLAAESAPSFLQVDQLIKAKKYSDAFVMLNELDPDNEDPYTFKRKIDLAIYHSIYSKGHQSFAIKNLTDGEDLQSLRGKEGNYELFVLDVMGIAPKLTEQFPEDYALKFAIGKYYHHMYSNCRECTTSNDEFMAEYEKLFQECYQHGEYDFLSTYGIGMAKIKHQEFESSIPFLLKSIELNDSYASSHYSLSYAFLKLDDSENAIKYAENAYERFHVNSRKADAAELAARAFNKKNDLEHAYQYYMKADHFDHGNYYILQPLLGLCVSLKKENEAAIRSKFFHLDSDNPTIYQDLIDIYNESGDIHDLLEYLERQTKYQTDKPTLANLDLYIGKIYYDLSNYELSKSYMTKANDEFNQIFSRNHEVFKIIEIYLNRM